MRKQAALLLAALAGAALGGLLLVRSGSEPAPPAAPPTAPPAPPAPAATAAPAPPPVQVDAGEAAPPASGGADDEAPCDPCFQRVPLLEDRSTEQVALVHGWPDADYLAAVDALWALQQQGRLDYAAARRADQALLLDRLLGTDIDAATRAALLDLHGSTMGTVLTAEKQPGFSPQATAARHAYEDGAAALLTDQQLDALLHGRPVERADTP